MFSQVKKALADLSYIHGRRQKKIIICKIPNIAHDNPVIK